MRTLSARREHAARAVLMLCNAIEAIASGNVTDGALYWRQGFEAHCELAFTSHYAELHLTPTLGVAY